MMRLKQGIITATSMASVIVLVILTVSVAAAVVRSSHAEEAAEDPVAELHTAQRKVACRSIQDRVLEQNDVLLRLMLAVDGSDTPGIKDAINGIPYLSVVGSDSDMKLSEIVTAVNTAITEARDVAKADVIDVPRLEAIFRDIDDSRNAVSKACLGEFMENLGESNTPVATE